MVPRADRAISHAGHHIGQVVMCAGSMVEDSDTQKERSPPHVRPISVHNLWTSRQNLAAQDRARVG
jgi:hypothetical protein